MSFDDADVVAGNSIGIGLVLRSHAGRGTIVASLRAMVAKWAELRGACCAAAW